MYTYLNKYPGEANYNSFGACAFTPDGSHLAVGGYGGGPGTNRGSIVVYTSDFSTKGNIIRGTVGNQIGKAIAINDAGDRIFASGNDSRTRVWHYNTETNIWDLTFTTPDEGASVFHGLSIRCNSAGTVFFVTNNDGSASSKITFFYYDGSIWQNDSGRNTLSDVNRYSWVSDSDSSANTIVGTSNQDQDALVSTWNGSNWTLKGTSIGGGNKNFVSSGMSPDGNTVALFDYQFEGVSAIYIYDWNGIAWVNRGNIEVLGGVDSRSRIIISSDKNTICFTGNGHTNVEWGVWSWDGTEWRQDLSFYNELVNNDVGIYVGNMIPAMSDDKRLVATPYTNYDEMNDVYEYGAAVFINENGPLPLIAPVNNSFLSHTQNFNVSSFNQKLSISPSLNILANDVYSNPQTQGTGTINATGLNENAILSSNGNLSINANHEVGDFTFTYTVTDLNNVESTSAEVSYRVINFGMNPATLPNIDPVYAGYETTILDQDSLVGPINSSSDLDNITITVTLQSGISPPAQFSAGEYDDGFSYTVNIPNTGTQRVTVTYTYLGNTLGFFRFFNIIDAIGTFGNNFVPPFVLNGVNGDISTENVLSDSTYEPADISLYTHNEDQTELDADFRIIVPPGTTSGVKTKTINIIYIPTGSVIGTLTYEYIVEGIDPVLTTVDDFSVGSPFVVGSSGGTTTSILDNDDPSTGVTVEIISDDGLTGVSFNETTNGLDIPPNSEPGDYVVTYRTNLGSVNSNVSNVYIRVESSPSNNNWVVGSESIEFLMEDSTTVPGPTTDGTIPATSNPIMSVVSESKQFLIDSIGRFFGA